MKVGKKSATMKAGNTKKNQVMKANQQSKIQLRRQITR